MIRIGILTSSRADFGIYLPLLIAMKKDRIFTFSIIAFGTHLSRYHGYTKDNIIESGFEVNYEIESLLLSDSPEANSTSTGLTYLKFASFWGANANKFDLIFCLGDRFEMFAAVYAGIPYGIKFAHIHGGETTLGAIDNIYRNAITLASSIHFTATKQFSNRVIDIQQTGKNVNTVGSLSLDNISETTILSIQEFFAKWEIDLSIPTILVTFHPETVAYFQIKEQSKIFIESLLQLSSEYQILLTLPNADTSGSILRKAISENLNEIKNIYIFENLGKQGYFTAMKHCCLLYGNSSSGIIEAASFNKYVVDLGKRQEGRLTSGNVINVNFDLIEITNAIEKVKGLGYFFSNKNVYYQKNVAHNILLILKGIYSE